MRQTPKLPAARVLMRAVDLVPRMVRLVGALLLLSCITMAKADSRSQALAKVTGAWTTGDGIVPILYQGGDKIALGLFMAKIVATVDNFDEERRTFTLSVVGADGSERTSALRIFSKDALSLVTPDGQITLLNYARPLTRQEQAALGSVLPQSPSPTVQRSPVAKSNELAPACKALMTVFTGCMADMANVLERSDPQLAANFRNKMVGGPEKNFNDKMRRLPYAEAEEGCQQPDVIEKFQSMAGDLASEALKKGFPVNTCHARFDALMQQ